MGALIKSLPRPTSWFKNIFLRDGVQVLFTIIGVKITIFVLSIVAFLLLVDGIGKQTPFQLLLHIWDRWDTGWYHGLADTGYSREGYAANRIVFLPLYPILIRITQYFTGSFITASLSVANILSIMGLYLFYLLARLEFNKKIAWYGLVALMLFPSAYFFNAAYTEGPFLCFAVGAFYLARRRWWMGAGIFGGLAAFTKIMGIYLFPALLIEFFLQWRFDRKSWPKILWLSLIPGTFMVYLFYNYQIYGDYFAFLNMVDGNWQKYFSWPWVGLKGRWLSIGTFPYHKWGIIMGLGEWLAGIGLLIGFIISLFRLRFSYTVYLFLVTFLVLSTTKLESTPRYFLTAFPIFFLLGMMGKHKFLALPWLILSVGYMTLLMTFFNHAWGAY